MKKLPLILTMLFYISPLFRQTPDTWTQKTNFGEQVVMVLLVSVSAIKVT
jgi:hypothetical protein